MSPRAKREAREGEAETLQPSGLGRGGDPGGRGPQKPWDRPEKKPGSWIARRSSGLPELSILLRPFSVPAALLSPPRGFLSRPPPLSYSRSRCPLLPYPERPLGASLSSSGQGGWKSIQRDGMHGGGSCAGRERAGMKPERKGGVLCAHGVCGWGEGCKEVQFPRKNREPWTGILDKEP